MPEDMDIAIADGATTVGVGTVILGQDATLYQKSLLLALPDKSDSWSPLPPDHPIGILYQAQSRSRSFTHQSYQWADQQNIEEGGPFPKDNRAH